jgi:hypothetical protein
MNTIQSLPRPYRLAATVRDELRERRQARASRRNLERELASYTTTSEVNDLLGSLRGQDEAAVAQIREVVLRNQLRHGLHRAS